MNGAKKSSPKLVQSVLPTQVAKERWDKELSSSYSKLYYMDLKSGSC